MKLSEEVVSSLQENPSFQVFQDYVIEKVKEVGNIDGLDGMSNEMAGEEAKVRAKTTQRLIDIFKPVIKFNKAKTISDKDIKDREQDFGL